MQMPRRTALAGVGLVLFAGAIWVALPREESTAPALSDAVSMARADAVDASPPSPARPRPRDALEAPPAPRPAFVEVRDAATDRPLPGVVVELLDTRGNALERRATDARGRVDFAGGGPPPGGVVCRHPGYRLAGRFDLRADHTFRLEPARTVEVEITSVPHWLGAWVLEAELRYSKLIAAARALGNHATIARLADYAARAPLDAQRAVLPVEIETCCEVAILGHPPEAAAREELASVALVPGEERAVVDLHGVRRNECVYALRGAIELPDGYEATAVRVHHELLPELDASPCVASLRGPASFEVAQLCESKYEIDLNVSSGGAQGNWVLLLGPVQVHGDADARWRFDFRPQVYARVLGGGDRPVVRVNRESDGRRAECAVHWVNERELVVAGLAEGRYRIAADAAWRVGPSFAIEAGAHSLVELVLDAQPAVAVTVQIDAGKGRGPGTLVVRDLDTGLWLDRPAVTVGRSVPHLELRLPPGRYAVQVSYPDEFLERAVEARAGEQEPLEVVLR
jgi:hypothetical protein